MMFTRFYKSSIYMNSPYRNKKILINITFIAFWLNVINLHCQVYKYNYLTTNINYVLCPHGNYLFPCAIFPRKS